MTEEANAQFEEGNNVSEVPETLTMSEEDVKNLKQPPLLLKEGWMPMEVASRKKQVCDTGTFNLKFQCAPVDEDGEALTRGRAPLDVYLPLANPNKAGHKAPNTLMGCKFVLRAFGIEYEQPPRRVKGKSGVYEAPDGRIITQREAGPMYDASDRSAAQAILDLWNDDTAGLGKRFYGKVVHEVSEKDGKIYMKVAQTRAEPPEDEPVITTDFIVK